MTTIGSIGIGLLILIIVWIFALGIFVIAVKLQSNIAWIALCSASIITIALVSFPVEKHNREIYNLETKEKDFTVLYNNLLFTFLVFSVIVSFVAFFLFHCIKPVRVKPIEGFYQNNKT